MSIAVSAVIKPSRLLYILLSCSCLVVCAIGGIIGLGLIGDLSTFQKTIILACSFSAALFAFNIFCHGKKTLRIDISGIGKIRLTHYSVLEPLLDATEHLAEQKGEIVQLKQGSTLWPHLMVMRLESDRGEIHVVPILADSVSPEEFKSLSVSLRWIAAHPGRMNDKK